jgi:preprotein translocase subunit SecG
LYVFFLFWIVFIVFVLTSVFLTSIILMQEPKQGGLGGLGGDSGMDFANIRGTAGGLHRLTIFVGIFWGLLAIALAIIPRG